MKLDLELDTYLKCMPNNLLTPFIFKQLMAILKLQLKKSPSKVRTKNMEYKMY